ncbi:MAG: lecithin retinol acyltransferase family protein [Oscillospiraceae bacterium]|nr:lecithin retinol acyltransferase family protein [Oscillospiraceae bacterium]
MIDVIAEREYIVYIDVKKNNIGKYKKGEIIKIKSVFTLISKVPIWHYGVVVGDDEVVHFNLNMEEKDIQIIKTSLKEFIGAGWDLKVCQMTKLNCKFDSDTIARRALNEVGWNFGGYDLINNNCEHFANWCACGEKYSNQILKNEGDGHNIGEKVFEKVIAEPVFEVFDAIDKKIDKLEEDTDKFFDFINRIFY